MHVVIIKHGTSNEQYIFSVPEGKTLKEGDCVLVKNTRGETAGVCVCDSFEIASSPLNAIMKRYGAKHPLAPVIGAMTLERWEADE